MGSYASSSNLSTTANVNAPFTQSEVSNPINLANASGNKFNTMETSSHVDRSNIAYNLDGGAISKSFEFGNNAIKTVADLVIGLGNAKQSATGAAIAAGEPLQTVNKPSANTVTDWVNANKTALIVAAVAVGYFVFIRK